MHIKRSARRIELHKHLDYFIICFVKEDQEECFLK